jgi:DNA polymerase
MRPAAGRIASCEPHLFRQIELIEPKLVATLGNFATKLLSGKPAGITRVHGYEQEVTLGARTVLLYPIYHPAAALYTPSMLKVLEEDFARIPALLERTVDDAPADEPVAPVFEADPESVQLGLF